MKLQGIRLQGYKRIAQAIEEPATPTENPDSGLPGTLYHTTSVEGAEGITESGELRARDDGFVSLSEVPVSGGDLEGDDVVLEVKRPDGVMKVEYTTEWLNKYPEQSSYIAGEDWEDQLDEDGKSEALLQAFLIKEPEKEWVSKELGKNIPVEIVESEKLEKESRTSNETLNNMLSAAQQFVNEGKLVVQDGKFGVVREAVESLPQVGDVVVQVSDFLNQYISVIAKTKSKR